MNNIRGTNLFIGDLKSSSNIKLLTKNNISYILNVCQDKNKKKYKHIKYKMVKMRDDDTEILFNKLNSCFKFIDTALKNKKNVLIHCYAGISRSAAVLISYLMTRYRLRYKDAYKIVKKYRNIINPNDNFKNQLKLIDKLAS
jgi:protein-tyrosine phosphatase